MAAHASTAVANAAPELVSKASRVPKSGIGAAPPATPMTRKATEVGAHAVNVDASAMTSMRPARRMSVMTYPDVHSFLAFFDENLLGSFEGAV